MLEYADVEFVDCISELLSYFDGSRVKDYLCFLTYGDRGFRNSVQSYAQSSSAVNSFRGRLVKLTPCSFQAMSPTLLNIILP